jgi:hypothetical protein
MLLDLQLPLPLPELLDHPLRLCQLALQLPLRRPQPLQLPLDLADLLNLDQHSSPLRSASSREHARGVVDVSVESDGLEENGLVKGNGGRGFRVGTDEGRAEDKGHGGGELVVVADEGDGRLDLVGRDLLSSSEFLYCDSSQSRRKSVMAQGQGCRKMSFRRTGLRTSFGTLAAWILFNGRSVTRFLRLCLLPNRLVATFSS